MASHRTKLIFEAWNWPQGWEEEKRPKGPAPYVFFGDVKVMPARVSVHGWTRPSDDEIKEALRHNGFTLSEVLPAEPIHMGEHSETIEI